MNKFSYFSLPSPAALPPFTRFPVLLAVKSIFPKTSWETCRNRSKTPYTIHYIIATHPHNTTPSVPKLNTQKYHTFISLTHPIYPLLNLTPSPIVPKFIPIEESDEAHSWMAERIGWRGELREQPNKNRESLIESGLIFDISSGKISSIVTLEGCT